MDAAPSVEPYRPRHHVRIVTAASLFDGHDAAINVMRRILQKSGAVVIHLGHNRSVAEIVGEENVTSDPARLASYFASNPEPENLVAACPASTEEVQKRPDALLHELDRPELSALKL